MLSFTSSKEILVAIIQNVQNEFAASNERVNESRMSQRNSTEQSTKTKQKNREKNSFS